MRKVRNNWKQYTDTKVHLFSIENLKCLFTDQSCEIRILLIEDYRMILH